MYRRGKLADALDAAITESAAAEFARLTRDLGEHEKGRRVALALDSLHGSIRRLEMPAYAEELVALFYGVWYQPFQINSAYSLVNRAIEIRERSLARKRRLDIVDFGSGTLAMEVGLLFAILDAQERGIVIPNINVFLVEPFDPMTLNGFDLWERFIVAIGHQVEVDRASWAATALVDGFAISLARVGDFSDIEAPPHAERWLVAMHAYYAESKEGIRQHLREIHDAFNPELGLMTCHHVNFEGIDYVSPFAQPGVQTPIPPLRFTGELPLVNRWRRQLADELGYSDDPRLVRPVEWDPERGQRDNRAILFHH